MQGGAGPPFHRGPREIAVVGCGFRGVVRNPPLSGTFGAPSVLPFGAIGYVGGAAKTDSSKDHGAFEFLLPPPPWHFYRPPAPGRAQQRPGAGVWTSAARSRFDGRARLVRGVALLVDSEEGAWGAEPRACDCHPWPGHG